MKLNILKNELKCERHIMNMRIFSSIYRTFELTEHFILFIIIQIIFFIMIIF